VRALSLQVNSNFRLGEKASTCSTLVHGRQDFVYSDGASPARAHALPNAREELSQIIARSAASSTDARGPAPPELRARAAPGAALAPADPNATRVREVMTKDVVYCFEDDDVREAPKKMEEH
jgi:hypothetical protein